MLARSFRLRLVCKLAAIGVLLTPIAALAQEYAAKVDAFVQRKVESGIFQGCALVAREGKPVYRKCYGMANVEWDLPNTPDTKFRIGSITKQFTAMAVLQLVEQGRIKLDDPVSKHYAEAPESWSKVTVHHLLTHTSGIPSYDYQADFLAKQSRDPRSPVEIVKLTQHLPLQFEPGEKMRYNNTGYVLLGHIVEIASGELYPNYLREHIFEPLGMKDTGYDRSAVILKKRASGYTESGRNAPYIDMSLPHAAGALYSTVDDLLLWDQALDARKLLSPESYEKYFTPFKQDYAYGWVVNKKFERRLFSHAGGIHGFNSMIQRYVDDKLTVIVLGNKNGRAVDEVADALGRLYFESITGESLLPAQGSERSK